MAAVQKLQSYITYVVLKGCSYYGADSAMISMSVICSGFRCELVNIHFFFSILVDIWGKPQMSALSRVPLCIFFVKASRGTNTAWLWPHHLVAESRELVRKALCHYLLASRRFLNRMKSQFIPVDLQHYNGPRLESRRFNTSYALPRMMSRHHCGLKHTQI